MGLNKAQVEGFNKIIKKGMEHYKVVPQSLGMFEHVPEQGIVGYVVWKDEEAKFRTTKGENHQEFYIRDDGQICIYRKVEEDFVPVNMRARNWRNFCSPIVEGSEDER